MIPSPSGHGEWSATSGGRMQDAFLTSSRYEYMFWEMAYQRRTWPL